MKENLHCNRRLIFFSIHLPHYVDLYSAYILKMVNDMYIFIYNTILGKKKTILLLYSTKSQPVDDKIKLIEIGKSLRFYIMFAEKEEQNKSTFSIYI